MLNKSQLESVTADLSLQRIVSDILEACLNFYKCVDSKAGYTTNCNQSGDVQLAMDVLADQMITQVLSRNPEVALLASEEKDECLRVNDEGEYAVCYDPVDGSSIVDANMAFGSVFGVYKRKDFVGAQASDLVMSVLVIYGPKIMVYVVAEKGVCEFLGNHEEFELLADNVMLDGKKPIMAIGNLALVLQDQSYNKFFNYLLENKISMRYSGSLTVEVAHILSKRAGVFMYCVAEGKRPKLRLLYECGPLAFLIEKAGGKSFDLQKSVLECRVGELHENVNFLVADQSLYTKFREIYG